MFGCNQPTTLDLPIPPIHRISFTDQAITVDGKMDTAWEQADWSDLFVDIEGADKPVPYFDTRIKMLWDDTYFYVFAYMEEPHVWGDITQRDAVIFHNNDFEVFIKPNLYKPYYTEFEVNALGTLWELVLLSPYRIGGPVSNRWDVNDTQIGIDVQGTLNDPTDIDSSWTLEMAIPISALDELDRSKSFEVGDFWRVNFSRVQWQHQILNNTYQRKLDDDGKLLAENNWVYTPQYAIAMHRPEHWTYMQFIKSENDHRDLDFLEAYQLAYHLFRQQLNYRNEHNSYSSDITDFGGPKFKVQGITFTATTLTTHTGFEIVVSHPSEGSLSIDQNENITIKRYE